MTFRSPDHPVIPSSRPRHVAIIMDGNGRWASSRGLPRTAGHKQGAEAVRRVVEAAIELEIGYLTLFGFSSENWKRPVGEVRELMRLMRYYLRSETAELHKNNVRLRIIGDREGLEPDIVTLIDHAESLTKLNTRLNLTIAINYGGRHDILEAARRMALDFHARGIAPDFSRVEEVFPHYLMTAGMPDPDILIRTSGELRISNFLLWQCAYAEFVFTETLWPDFGKADLEAAIRDFGRRERRFGGVKESGGGEV